MTADARRCSSARTENHPAQAPLAGQTAQRQALLTTTTICEPAPHRERPTSGQQRAHFRSEPRAERRPALFKLTAQSSCHAAV